MFLVFSIGMWLAVCVVLAVLARSECVRSELSRGKLVLWGVLITGALLIFFRPHENIRSGEDPGVYVNTAARFAQEKGLFFQDKLLVQVDPDIRYYFLFGHRFYGVTKDSCFGLKHIDSCILGPRFSSLYPVIMSLPCMIFGSPVPLFYVAPLFAILTGLMLALVAKRLIDHPWTAPLVFFLYSITPLVAWHGRAARAEMPASFFIFAGVLFLVKAWQENQKTSWISVLLGACCMAAAPFFHISSWFVAIPAGLIAVVAAVSGRKSFLVYPPVAVAGLAAFIWLAENVSDHYQIMRHIGPVLKHSQALVAGTAILYAAVVCSSVFSDRVLGVLKKKIVSTFSKERFVLALRAVLFFLITGVMVWMYFRSEPIAERRFTGYEYHYAHPTDLRVVREFVSRIACVLTVIGMGSLLLRSGKGMLERIVVFLCLLPAALLMGNMYDIFMTRYLVPVLLPLMVLCLASIITLVPVKRVGEKISFVCVTAIFCLILTHHRSQLITVTEGKGTMRFAESIAEKIDAKNSILLSEYARMATPFEHMFGIPLLSLDNETRSDYRPAMEAWEKIMRENPDKKAYFLTPFREPVSSRFIFKQVLSEEVEYDKLHRGRYQLPREKKKGKDSLTLYTMELADKQAPELPFVRDFDSSNMGLWQFSKFRTKKWDMKGLQIGPEKSAVVTLPENKAELGSSLLLFYAVSGTDNPKPPNVYLDQKKDPLSSRAWKNLTAEWWVQVLECPATETLKELKLLSEAEMYLTNVQLVGPGNGWNHSVAASSESAEKFLSSSFAGRWSLAECGFAAPVPEWEDGCLFLLFSASGEEGSVTSIKLGRENTTLPVNTVSVGEWTWQAWPMKHLRDKPGFSAFDMKIDPVYDPGLTGYPKDLGVRVGYIVVLDQIHL